MAAAWVQSTLVVLALAGAAAYLGRRAWVRWTRARQPQSGRCGPDCGCGPDGDY